VKDIIIISTSPGREDWVKEILTSISRPVIVISDFGYELGKIKWAYENTNCDRFLFLQDSLVVRDESLFDQVFEVSGSSCIMDVPSCLGSYMGVYERSVLSRLDIPEISTKEESIFFEIDWTQKYIALCENFSHPVSIVHKEIETVRKFGRENLLYVNQYYEKWKGDWGVPITDYKPLANPIELERANLQMLEKSRIIQNLTKELWELKTGHADSRESMLFEIESLKIQSSRLASLQGEIDALVYEVGSKEKELLAIRESRIWRLFRPYRSFIQFFKGMVK
jgi:hypothetical protein